MSQKVKVLAKSYDLSLSPGTQGWRQKTKSYKLPSDLHICSVAHTKIHNVKQ